jgi:hypothetical protein
MLDKIFKVVSIIVALTAVALVLYFVFLGGSSVKGKVTAPHPDSNSQTLSQQLTLKGQYFSMQYPHEFVNNSTQHPQVGPLEQYVLTSSAFEGKQMAIAITKDPGDLHENSGYNYRAAYSSLYTPKTMKIVGGSATIMTKNDGSEQTAFIQNGTYLATIAITYTGQTGTDLGS